MNKLAIIALACAVIGCGPSAKSNNGDGGVDGDAGSNNQPHTLSAIEITPTNPIVELDLNAPGTQTFSVTGEFQDGVDEDITDRVTWTVANAAVGTITDATLAIPARAAVGVEVSRITAELDGVIGEAQITVVAYRKTGASQDFFFVLPYQDPTGLMAKPLEFGTAVPSLDVFFLTDTTGSMIDEITNLRNALSGTIVPGIQAIVPDTQFGAGSFEDFPLEPYGFTGDQPLHVFQTITNSVSAVQAGMNQYTNGNAPRGNGNDWAEGSMEALYQVATGAGLSTPAPTSVPANTTGVGGVGFRSTSMPVVVTVTDAFMHGPNETNTCVVNNGFGFTTLTTAYEGAVAAASHSRAQTKTALGNICARSVGVATQQSGFPATCSGQADLEDFATSTGARVPPGAWDVGTRPAGCGAGQCCTNFNGTGRAPDANGLCPLVYLADNAGSGLGNHITTGIQMLARFAQFDVTSERVGVATDVAGVALPAGHTTADFIKEVTPVGFTLPAAPPIVPNPTFDAVAFHGVTPNTKVKFDVKALNDFVPQTQTAQIFRATVKVLASGCTALDERQVLILVPPNPLVIQ